MKITRIRKAVSITEYPAIGKISVKASTLLVVVLFIYWSIRVLMKWIISYFGGSKTEQSFICQLKCFLLNYHSLLTDLCPTSLISCHHNLPVRDSLKWAAGARLWSSTVIVFCVLSPKLFHNCHTKCQYGTAIYSNLMWWFDVLLNFEIKWEKCVYNLQSN